MCMSCGFCVRFEEYEARSDFQPNACNGMRALFQFILVLDNGYGRPWDIEFAAALRHNQALETLSLIRMV